MPDASVPFRIALKSIVGVGIGLDPAFGVLLNLFVRNGLRTDDTYIVDIVESPRPFRQAVPAGSNIALT